LHITSFTDDLTFEDTFPTVMNAQNTDGTWSDPTPVYDVRGIRQHKMAYFLRAYPEFLYTPEAFPAPSENSLGAWPVNIP